MLPFQSSVNAGDTAPPKPKAAVLLPAPPKPFLAVFKSETSVQLLPFQDSVKFLFPPVGLLNPPKTNEAVFEIPADPVRYLALPTLLTSVQLVPL